ncbi:transcription factor 7-like 1-B [Epinephelus moara]|uniref:transcription factor 7-like 1-B n=1 Tax=Epinephelus moara TaxID=300413 RepID=UPI00214F0421|nr:transcription factor 7-like 1-B [Epinephelus moara]
MSAKHMDLHPESQHAMKEMNERDLLSIQGTLKVDLVDTANLPTLSLSSPPPSSPVVPAGKNIAIHPQPVESLGGGGDDGCLPLAAAPVKSAPGLNAEQMQHVSSAAASYCAAPPQTCNNVPLTKLPEGLTQNLRPVGVVLSNHLLCVCLCLQRNNVLVTKLPEGLTQNLRPVGEVRGELVYEIPADSFTLSDSAAPPPSQNKKKSNRKPKCEDKQDDIKMPLNAFMLFLKEKRLKLAAELAMTESAVVNAVLGHRWRTLSKEEKAKYYEAARKEKELHEQQYPDWSPHSGKKKKKEKPKHHKKKSSPSVK